jgi:superfamily II DNA helicase RecQ
MALTGAANENVKADIIKQLSLGIANPKGLLSVQSTFNRPNLFYEVKRKSLQSVVDAIQEAPASYSGIQFFGRLKANFPSQAQLSYTVLRSTIPRI